MLLLLGDETTEKLLLKTVLGDSKIDNFMFKKVSWSYHVDGPDDVYNAVIVDWQVISENQRKEILSSLL